MYSKQHNANSRSWGSSRKQVTWEVAMVMSPTCVSDVFDSLGDVASA